MPASKRSRRAMRLAGGRKRYAKQLKRTIKQSKAVDKATGKQHHAKTLAPDVETRLLERAKKRRVIG